MKKLIVLIIGVLFCASLLAVVNITTTKAEVNDVLYNCKGGDSLFFDLRDFGNLSSLTINGSLKNTGVSGSSIAYMHYRFDGADWRTKILDKKTSFSDGGGGERLSLDPGAGDPSTDINVFMKTLTTYESFTGSTDVNLDLSGLNNGQEYSLEVFFKLGGVFDPADTTDNYYTATFTKIAEVYLYDGSSYTPGQPTKGSNEQVIGRFDLEADVTGANLTAASFEFDGTRTGFSNFKLWSSTDNTFGGDTQLGSTVAADPGAGTADFSGFTSAIPTSGVYYFITADVAEDATGGIQGYIAETADLTITSGEFDESFTNAPLSSSEVPTSICLVSFDVTVNNGKVDLSWTTESETENSHFLIYRDDEVIAQIQGAGTTTEQHTYTYLDTRVQSGVHNYVLADVSYDGIEAKQAPVAIEIESNEIEANFVLNKAYPNPFNPRVALSMEYGVGSNTVVNIYNTQGALVENLINGFVEAGHHEVIWDASDMCSGVYIVNMVVGDVVQSQKVVLMK